MADKDLFNFVLHMGDNCLVLGQRVAEWCGHAPILEEDIAMANIGLDLIGQTKLWLNLAGEMEGKGRSADDLAYLRTDRAFRNCLLVEQPNGDYGKTLMRQFLFDAWHHPMLVALMGSADHRVAAVAEKAVKEVSYHLERSTDLVIRLGDGSEESHGRMQAALEELWRFTAELVTPDVVDEALATAKVAPDLAQIADSYERYISQVFTEAMLTPPADTFMQYGGKQGVHTEGFGYLLAEMQVLQRTYPGASW